MLDPLPQPSPSALVLVVDDEIKNIQVVGSLLLKHGHEVIGSTSGADALVKLETARPDLILLDVMMPGMTGFELCRKLRENPELRDIPIIFLSAAADKNFVVEALDAGAVDYVTKPFHGAELISRVELHANLRRVHRQLEKVVREKNRLLEIVAHDLKNPLSGIQFAANMLAENGGLPPASRDHLVGSILDSAKRAFEIVAGLLETRGLEEAKASIIKDNVCLHEHVIKAVKNFNEHARRKNMELNLVASGRGIRVVGESRSLLCCVENLISNAIKFSPRESKVTVTIDSTPHFGIFKIEDEGPGILDSEVELLFGKFTRLSARPTAGEPSTGMGLHIVNELVNVMGGSVGYRQRENGGACFVIELPLAD